MSRPPNTPMTGIVFDIDRKLTSHVRSLPV
jgi:hypothetical protein